MSLRLPRPAFLRLILFAVAFALAAGVGAARKFPTPANDSVDYLSYARSLYLSGSYAGTPEGPQADIRPGREPLYPLMVAVAARLYPPLATALVECSPPSDGCASGFRALAFVNAALVAGTAVVAAMLAERLGGGRLAWVVAWGYIAFNFQSLKDVKYVISDYLAVFLAALAGLALVAAVQRRESWWRWLAAGLALAALGLCKAIFVPFGALVVAVLLAAGAWGLRRRGPRALAPALLVAAVLAAVNGGWILRNVVWFGVADDGRSYVALSTREVFDHMRPDEHLAAWLWWTRGPGDDWAKGLLPRESWRRHEWYEADGFYLQGQNARNQERMARLMAGGLDESQARKRMAGVIVGEILDHLPDYLLTMPVLFYRGIWFDEFIVFGLPMLVWGLGWAVKRRRWDVVAALSAGLWSLTVYPAISLNIPRYQLVAVTALAVAAGLGSERLWLARRRDRGPSA
ncbi:MAG: phospholipid carrier-dependent glycosyltransferase [Pseudomonadota bacterium]